MNIRALVPVKSLEYAKSRLAKKLSLQDRKQLVLQMLEHVLSVLQLCEEITQISVVTPDTDVTQQAAKFKTKILLEGRPGHNPALYAAALHEKVEGAQGLLTISADLPLVTEKDVHTLVELSKTNDIVLAPSKDNGTNAILMRSPLLLPYLFGENSFEKYLLSAQKKGLTVALYKSKTIAFDVDTVEDLNSYQTITSQM